MNAMNVVADQREMPPTHRLQDLLEEDCEGDDHAGRRKDACRKVGRSEANILLSLVHQLEYT